jgi:hypothetical protein
MQEELSKETIKLIHAYIEDVILPVTFQEQGPEHLFVASPGVTRDKYWKSYHSWGNSNCKRAWYRYQFGGTWIVACIYWYQHIHKPQSSEWRPKIIMDAVLTAALCANNCLHADCPAIPQFATKFKVSATQLREFIERPFMGRTVNKFDLTLPTRGEKWYRRIRASIIGAAGR